MNILRAAALVAILVTCVTASGDDMSQFREAVDGNDMDKAVKLCWSISEDLCEKLNYVVDTKDEEFIFKFFKQAKTRHGALLAALHRKKSFMIIEEAFKVFKFSQNDLA